MTKAFSNNYATIPDAYDYSQEFKDYILEMLKDRPAEEQRRNWYAMAMSRVAFQRRHFLPTISRFVDLKDKRVLEIGCGTGPSTVVMAACGASIEARDINERMVEAARLRVRDHGFSDRVNVQVTSDSSKLDFPDGHFDIAVVNGVLEHVHPEMRKGILHEIWRVLKGGGCLFIGETPNRLFPYDDHTTGLWGLHYLPARMAQRYAKLRKRIGPEDDLIDMGGLGCTYRELVHALPAKGVEILNLRRDVSWASRKAAESARGHIIKRCCYRLIGFFDVHFLRPVFRMPIEGLMPYLSLCLLKAIPFQDLIQ
jgi:ubiquinone/menaquinone biosynthesis C-methylase UbiE